MRPAILIIAILAPLAAGEAPFVGFRGDGSGGFPADCTPPTTWNEAGWEWRKQQVQGKFGKTEELAIPRLTDQKPQNVVWKIRLPWYGHSGITPAKGRLFLMREMDPGPIPNDTLGVLPNSGNVDELPDIALDAPIPEGWEPGPSLVCLDPKDGTVLWSRGVHGLDLLPESERAKVRAEMWWYVRYNWRRWQLVYRLEALDAANGGGSTGKNAGAGLRAKTAEARALLKALRDIGSESLSEAEEAAAFAPGGEFPVRKGSFSPLGEPNKVNAARIKALRAKGFWFTGYGTHGGPGVGGYDVAGQQWAGEGCQTPAWDGTRLYVTTTNRVVAAFDTDGKRQWLVRLTGTEDQSRGFDQLASPVAVEGKVIIYSGGPVGCRALDGATGKVAWEVKRAGDGGVGYKGKHPVLLTVGGERILHQNDGMMVRCRDGKVVAEKICNTGGHCQATSLGDVLFFASAGQDRPYVGTTTFQFAEQDNGSLQAIRFTADGPDKVKGTRLWQTGKEIRPGQTQSPVVANGLVFMEMGPASRTSNATSGVHVFDAATGALVKVLGDRSRSSGGNMKGEVWTGLWCPLAAGGKVIFANPSRGLFTVIEANRELKILGQDNFLLGRLPDGHPKPVQDGWAPRLSDMLPMCFSGNRLFVRTHEYVYCLGNPGEPLRLSELHR